MSFSLANLSTPEGERAALRIGDAYWRLDRLGRPGLDVSVRALLDRWPAAWPELEGLAQLCACSDAPLSARVPQEEAQLTAPIKYPNKLVCVGAVYRDHLMEFNLPPQRWPKMPMFLRPPTTSILGPGAAIPMPPATREFDWEIELAVVIGNRLTDGDLHTAQRAIAGFSVGLDLTCRDLLDPKAPAGVDLVRAKAQDGMAPLGPALMPAAFVGDPQQLALKLWVNGELRQDGHTSDMLFSVYEQVATISRYITLEPGDVVFTGSCAGSGASIGQFLRPGDRIEAEIERVGRLEVSIAPPRARPPNYTESLVA